MSSIFDAISVTFRPVVPEDEPFVLDLYGIIRDPEISQLNWSQEQRDAFVKMQFDLMNLHYRTNHPDRIETIILREGAMAGRLIVMVMEDEVRLGDIMVLPEHRRYGICTAVMRHWVAEGVRTNKPIRLHVERFNPARSLYERENFALIGETPTHFLMEWQGNPDEALALIP